MQRSGQYGHHTPKKRDQAERRKKSTHTHTISAFLSASSSLSPQNEVVASLLRSRGGAHLDHIPWHAGYVTP